ncbi:MAG: aminoacyl-tRNA hydrolase [Saprospiraceae bacterium]|nr:aminoacyl-tRNA hydrolase [Saprospiraceae bacterium]
MKYLIVGLGNVGAEYANTRHNVGFLVVDEIAKKNDAEWKQEGKAMVTKVKHRGRTLVLIKPTTYMNLSGKAVRYWMQKEKIPKDRMLVILDDLNLDFGKLRLRGKGSAGGHNGLKDIDQTTGGNNYARLRIGIGSDFRKGGQSDYVLGEWSSEEESGLAEVLKKATDAVGSFAAIGLGRTMNTVN